MLTDVVVASQNQNADAVGYGRDDNALHQPRQAGHTAAQADEAAVPGKEDEPSAPTSVVDERLKEGGDPVSARYRWLYA